MQDKFYITNTDTGLMPYDLFEAIKTYYLDFINRSSDESVKDVRDTLVFDLDITEHANIVSNVRLCNRCAEFPDVCRNAKNKKVSKTFKIFAIMTNKSFSRKASITFRTKIDPCTKRIHIDWFDMVAYNNFRGILGYPATDRFSRLRDDYFRFNPEVGIVLKNRFNKYLEAGKLKLDQDAKKEDKK
jgi:hypothetical protein